MIELKYRKMYLLPGETVEDYRRREEEEKEKRETIKLTAEDVIQMDRVEEEKQEAYTVFTCIGGRAADCNYITVYPSRKIYRVDNTKTAKTLPGDFHVIEVNNTNEIDFLTRQLLCCGYRRIIIEG